MRAAEAMECSVLGSLEDLVRPVFEGKEPQLSRVHAVQQRAYSRHHTGDFGMLQDTENEYCIELKGATIS